MSVTEIVKRNINTLTSEERKALMHAKFTQTSSFERVFYKDYVETACQLFSDNLRAEIIRILIDRNIIRHEVPLEELHQYIDAELCDYNFDDGVNKISTYFYDTDAQFLQVYHQFIKFLEQKIIKQPFWFQQTPTIRIHCPNGKNSHHYPRYHTDIGYGHPPEEINLWMPLTQKLSGHSFRLMNVQDSCKILDDFNFDFTPFITKAIHDKEFTQFCNQFAKPVEAEFGQLMLFDSRCIHTGEPVRNHTRVSIDIRILLIRDYANMDIEYQGSGRRKIIFAPGNCYYYLSSNQL